jgi:hypothetical protein
MDTNDSEKLAASIFIVNEWSHFHSSSTRLNRVTSYTALLGKTKPAFNDSESSLSYKRPSLELIPFQLILSISSKSISLTFLLILSSYICQSLLSVLFLSDVWNCVPTSILLMFSPAFYTSHQHSKIFLKDEKQTDNSKEHVISIFRAKE